MAKSEHRWIVLVHKRPRGPLTTDEVKALIDNGLVGHNDLAFLVPGPDEAPTHSDWKLLWQFPEFDRRAEEAANAESAKAAKSAKERREPVSMAATEQKIQQTLPPDLMNLSPADLIPKATGPTQVELQDIEKLIAEDAAQSPVRPLLRKAGIRAGAAICFFSLLAFFFRGGVERPKLSLPLSNLPVIDDKLAPPNAAVPSRAPTSPSGNSAAPAVAAPSAPASREPSPQDSDRGSGTRDRGYVSEDRRDPAEEEPVDDESVQEDDEEEEEEVPKRKKGRKKKKKKRLPEREQAEESEEAPEEESEELESEGRE